MKLDFPDLTYAVSLSLYFFEMRVLTAGLAVYMGCGDVIISTVTMVVATTPCFRYEKHYHCVRFYIDGVCFWVIFVVPTHNKRNSISRHGRTQLLHTTWPRNAMNLAKTSLSVTLSILC